MSAVEAPALDVELDITGMTCAACANRIERKLNKLDGVVATVNTATDRARVRVDAGAAADTATLIATVEAAGYGAALPEPPTTPGTSTGAGAGTTAPHAPLTTRLVVTAVLAVPVVVLAMLPVAQFPGWQFVALALSLPIVSWGAWPFHRTAVTTARHGGATMDTLVSVGVSAATLWSIWTVLDTTLHPGRAMGHVYLEVAAAVTVFVLLGRWIEARAKQRSGAALTALLELGATMDTLVSVGVSAATLWSIWTVLDTTLHPGRAMGHVYLEVAAAVTVFVLLGRWIEARAKQRSGAALTALLELGATDATRIGTLGPDDAVIPDTEETRVPVSDLVPGDVVRVRPGGTIPSDGVVVDGAAAVDRSMLSGEPLPVETSVGAFVTGGTTALDGTLVIRITRVGADTELARMGRLVTEAQTGKADVQRLADRVSGVFVPVVLGLALVTLVGWLVVAALGGSMPTGAAATPGSAIAAAVATLVIACPCALGLATPTALLVGTGRGAQLGILVRGPQALERTRRIDTVVLDKTGTVTSGRMTLQSAIGINGTDEAELMNIAAAAERGSEHPVARAIVMADGGPVGRTTLAATAFRAHAGAGIEAVVDGHAVQVGRADWLSTAWAVTVPSDAARVASAWEGRGATATLVAWDGSVRGVLAVADTVRTGSADAVAAFRALGLEPMMLTGDSSGAARFVADAVGIERVVAGVSPAGKLDVIRALQAEGRTVAMVGDGVNDAAALAAADLGIAVGGGTDVAIAASDLTVVSADLGAVVDAVRLARATLRTIHGNLFWAFAYNVAAVPIAMLGLLDPMFAGAAMAFSSVFVVTNSLRLRRFRPARALALSHGAPSPR